MGWGGLAVIGGEGPGIGLRPGRMLGGVGDLLGGSDGGVERAELVVQLAEVEAGLNEVGTQLN